MAGTAVGKLITGTVDRTLSYTKAWEVSLTADASDALFPVYSLPSDFAGMISDISVVFDGTTPPNSLTCLTKDGYGLTIHSVGPITASTGRGLLDANVAVVGGGSITVTGNTTNSAKVKVILYLID